jgi:nucleotide-binding universal stress UspA family protein
MLKLLIAVDGSEHARRAIEAAARLADEAPALEAVLLNVREPIGYADDLTAADCEPVERVARARQQALLDAALTHAHSCGLDQVVALSAAGPVAQEIANAAGEPGVDLIVMGTRGMNALAGLVLGSVAQRVVHLAQVPVLLVK